VSIERLEQGERPSYGFSESLVVFGADGHESERGAELLRQLGYENVLVIPDGYPWLVAEGFERDALRVYLAEDGKAAIDVNMDRGWLVADLLYDLDDSASVVALFKAIETALAPGARPQPLAYTEHRVSFTDQDARIESLKWGESVEVALSLLREITGDWIAARWPDLLEHWSRE
jgi:hypothetical protein